MAVLYICIFFAFTQISYLIHAAPADMDIEGMMKECNKTYPINPEYIHDLNETGSFPEEDTKQPKCFLRCMFMMAGVMDEQGNFDVPKLKEQMKDPKYPDMDAMIDMCIAKDTETTCMCNKAYLLSKCIMTEQPQKFGRLEAAQDDDDMGDGSTFREMITGFLRDMGSTVLTVLSVLNQFREVIASAMSG